MITEEKLQEAIAECWGEREPNANTCYKLAAYFTILNQIRTGADPLTPYPLYSHDAPEQPASPQQLVDIDSESEFAEATRGRNTSEIWPIIDELMETLQVVNPRLYSAVMRKLRT